MVLSRCSRALRCLTFFSTLLLTIGRGVGLKYIICVSNEQESSEESRTVCHGFQRMSADSAELHLKVPHRSALPPSVGELQCPWAMLRRGSSLARGERKRSRVDTLRPSCCLKEVGGKEDMGSSD